MYRQGVIRSDSTAVFGFLALLPGLGSLETRLVPISSGDGVMDALGLASNVLIAACESGVSRSQPNADSQQAAPSAKRKAFVRLARESRIGRLSW